MLHARICCSEESVVTKEHLISKAMYTLRTKKSLKQLKALMPRAHVEARKGTIQQAIEYCQKEGDWEEHGEKPKMPKEKEKEKRKGGAESLRRRKKVMKTG